MPCALVYNTYTCSTFGPHIGLGPGASPFLPCTRDGPGENSSWGREKYPFYTCHKKIYFFFKILCANIECPDVYSKFLFRNFRYFKMHSLGSECIYTYDPKQSSPKITYKLVWSNAQTPFTWVRPRQKQTSLARLILCVGSRTLRVPLTPCLEIRRGVQGGFTWSRLCWR